MPELPEVEFSRRQLADWWVGRRVDEVVLHDPALMAHGDVAELDGAQVDGVERRGKFLLVRARGRALVLHFKMTGKVVKTQGRKARLSLVLGGQTFDFVDTRRLGKAWMVTDAELADPGTVGVLARLGPEPWPEALSGAEFERRLRGSRRAIKVALLDQTVLAGVGNIVAAESLWRAGIHPARRCCDLDLATLDALGQAIRDVCEGVLDVEDGEEIAYLNDSGGPEATNPFSVYQQERCPVCAGEIERLTQAGRTTYWCPTCQGE